MEIRLNIFDENNKWVGQEYLTEKGKWLHRWTLKGELEKGSWRGRAKGDNELNWRYERVEEECSSGLKANELLPLVSISLPDAIEKIKGYEKEALKQAGYAKRDGADISAHCSEAMAFAYKLSYQTLEGNEC